MEKAQPHVLIFPLQFQGHVNSMIQIAELLALAGFKITFLLFEYSHERLAKFTNFTAHFGRYPGFQFNTITDGLPHDHPRSSDRLYEMFVAMKTKTKPCLRDLLLNLNISYPVDCIIGDDVSVFALDVAEELGIPFFFVSMGSPCFFWALNSVPEIIQAGELPIRGNEDMDRLITEVPGMETFLRCRDLPSFCRESNYIEAIGQSVAERRSKYLAAKALILNTFEDLDGPFLSQMRNKYPNIYSIGPIHAQLNTRLDAKNEELTSCNKFQNSLWEVDKACIAWLNKQPKESVIYVSLGSMTITSREQHMELWYGLVHSKKRFLWVVRPDSVTGKDGQGVDVAAELLEGTKERGYIATWVPQEEVLNHPAVGGFLTQSGWNSVLESMIAGLPMICMPYVADHHVNSRFVSEVWKLGLDMKDVFDRKVVENMVTDLMVDRREEFVTSAAKMAKLAKQSVSVGGSSYCNLDRMIEDIRLMSLKKNHEN